jgi:hypothetical protein
MGIGIASRRFRPQSAVVVKTASYVGGKAKNRAYAKKPPTKHAVVALVE